MHNAVLLTAVVMVCYFDGRYRRIPNFITFSLVLLGSVINSWQSGWSGLGMSLVGIITGLLLLIIPYSSGGIGGGDVKFLAGIGSMLGAGFAFSAFLYGAVIGGIWAVVILIRRRNLLQSLMAISYRTAALASGAKAVAPPLHTTASGKEWGFPYGIAIGLGAAAAVFIGPLV